MRDASIVEKKLLHVRHELSASRSELESARAIFSVAEGRLRETQARFWQHHVHAASAAKQGIAGADMTAAVRALVSLNRDLDVASRTRKNALTRLSVLSDKVTRTSTQLDTLTRAKTDANQKAQALREAHRDECIQEVAVLAQQVGSGRLGARAQQVRRKQGNFDEFEPPQNLRRVNFGMYSAEARSGAGDQRGNVTIPDGDDHGIRRDVASPLAKPLTTLAPADSNLAATTALDVDVRLPSGVPVSMRISGRAEGAICAVVQTGNIDLLKAAFNARHSLFHTLREGGIPLRSLTIERSVDPHPEDDAGTSRRTRHREGDDELFGA